MERRRTRHRERIALLCGLLCLCMAGLTGRLFFLMTFRAEEYSAMAEDLHQRERSIKAARGRILDRNGTVIADNRTVCTVSVVHNQITEPERTAEVLSRELSIPLEDVKKKVEKYTAREIIKTNVDKEIGDRIREMALPGVKVDEDYKRYYPYDSLASRVLGFTGGDNQGIIGLEVQYESWLKGENGLILTLADAAGVEIENAAEDRIEPIPGHDLTVSLDVNIQKYAEQAAYQVMEKKSANSVSVIVMNPKNGEILAMVNVPEFNLNEPFNLTAGMEAEHKEEGQTVWLPASAEAQGEEKTDEPPEEAGGGEAKKRQDLLNQMWRNKCINDTYEPGSTFKIITAAAGLEAGVVDLDDTFSCPGFRIVEDRKIRCHKVGGHGGETFLQGMMNSCNPVLIDVGQRLGVDNYYRYFEQFGLMGKTGVDLPGEAATIMHRKENMGAVELATVSFGQSFQITPLQLITTASSIINGGNRVTPHFALRAENPSTGIVHEFEYKEKGRILSEETSAAMRYILEQVVAEGSGKNAKIEGYRIGGKTATSEKLPRSRKKYISSFLGFAPADDPQVIALITIDEPEGVYYGGTIAAPVVGDIFENILPYLGIPRAEEESTNS
ncbi:peptidoglycan glycosyltransferase [Clostridium sp. AM29-11AC]|nr:penicillin-binding transpeptidase domain-containing protein [Clostridium sp. AM29-11AC]RHT58012.1 peptidoglycan glycosyltransferase [Clostridium sp. AM29-11AC]